jgi:putative membrane protein
MESPEREWAVSYLNDPRVFFAAERTLLAWQRTAIALIGLGFVIERFGLFLTMISPGATLSPGHGRASLVFGVMFLLLGSLVATVSSLQFRRFMRELAAPEIPRGYATWFGPFINLWLAATALALAAWFVVTA